MDKSMLTGIGIGAVITTAGGAIAGYNMLTDNTPAQAEVLNVAEVTLTVQVPYQQCENVEVTLRRPVQDEKRIAGTVTGALVGGVLGKQVGGGSGKKIATVAGAVAGGYAGNQVQKNMQENDTYTRMEQRCHTAHKPQVDVIAYDVSYRLGSESGVVRMNHRPGPTIPVQDGQLVLSQSMEAVAKSSRQ